MFGRAARGNQQGLGPGGISAIPYIKLISVNVRLPLIVGVGMPGKLTSCKRCESAAELHRWRHRESCLRTESTGLSQPKLGHESSYSSLEFLESVAIGQFS